MAQPTIDLTGSVVKNATSGNTMTIASYVHPGGLLLCGMHYGNSADVSGITAGGTAMSLLTSINDPVGNNCQMDVWAVDKTAGTFDIVASGVQYEYRVLTAVSIPTATAATVQSRTTANADSTTNPACTCTTGAADDLIVAFYTVRRVVTDPATYTVASGNTEDINVRNTGTTNGVEAMVSHEDGAASVAMSYTGSANDWAVITVPVRAAAAAGFAGHSLGNAWSRIVQVAS